MGESRKDMDNPIGKVKQEEPFELVFMDSTTIDKKGNFKLEIAEYADSLNEIVNISLFEKQQGNWVSIQQINDTLDEEMHGRLDPDLIDINGQGWIDLNFKYLLPFRGANEVRKHYLFDRHAKQFTPIINSIDYSNLSYNEELDCFQSCAVFGGFATIFFQLDSDSLREFASIVMSDGQRVVTVTDKEGYQSIISEIPYDLESEDRDTAYGDYDISTLSEFKH